MRTVILWIIAAVVVAAVLWFVATPEDGERESPPQIDPDYVPASIPMPSEAQPATVSYVHDGDTLFLVTPDNPNLKVRLLAVDTPELEDCYGDEATDFTRGLLPEGATVYTLADVEPLDQYGRSLLFVWTADGTLVNYALVTSGMAESVFIGQNTRYDNEFEAAEGAARDAGAGVWGAC
jgi:micrococcal nuclease